MTELQITIQPALIQRVSGKYHYSEADLETLCQVASQMNRALKGQCGFWLNDGEMNTEMTVGVVMTLGAGIDQLQEEYTVQGHFVECYMTEVIAEELLLEGYIAFNRWVAESTGYHVKRYHFCEEGAGLSLEQMPHILAASRCDAVTCNEAYCLKPRKSVIFRAELTTDAGTVCEGICAGCNNEYCANRAVIVDRYSVGVIPSYFLNVWLK